MRITKGPCRKCHFFCGSSIEYPIVAVSQTTSFCHAVLSTLAENALRCRCQREMPIRGMATTGQVGLLPSDRQFDGTRETPASRHKWRYLSSRIEGVNVIPTNNPSGAMKRLTVWPHGSFLFFTSIRCPCDSSSRVAFSTLSTSNSSQACGAGISSGQESLPKQDCAACESGHRAKVFAPCRASV
jgi:hypothetical protein